MKASTILTIAASLLATTAPADDFAQLRDRNWHRWRGPAADGVAPHANPPITWDETTHVKWKVRIPGSGNSSPIVWQDRVFVSTAVETDRPAKPLPRPDVEPPGGYLTKPPAHYYRFVVLCLDRTTGRVRWQRVATEAVPHEGHHRDHGYASASPTTDGRFVYASFGSRGIYCYDLEGNLVWQRDLGDMITRFGWGEGASPVIDGDSLAVNWDHEGPSFLEVLDARTGESRWKVDRDEATSWSTPVVVHRRGTRQLIVSASRRVVAYDLDTGEILWECGGQTVNVIPSPVVADGVVYCMSGFKGGALYALPLDASGDLTGSDRIIWHRDRGTPYVPSPLLYDDWLYFTRSNNAILTCLDAKTGKPLIEGERIPGLQTLYASPVGAAGRVYFVGRDGTTVVLRHGAPLEVLVTNRLDDPIDASPALVDGEVFLRGKSFLYCLGE